jgi:hypothetical protein
MDAQVKQRLRTHTEYRQRIHPPLHTSYTMGCLSAPLSGDVFSGYYNQKTCNNPGLHPVKGQKPGLGAQTGS